MLEMEITFNERRFPASETKRKLTDNNGKESGMSKEKNVGKQLDIVAHPG